MDNKEVYKILKHFSFSETETEVYLAILKLGRAGVTEIARKIDIGRTAAYFHIKNLVERGYLKKVKAQSKYYFMAEKPEELAQEFEKNISNFKSLLPELDLLNKLDQETPVIDIKESSRAMMDIYDDLGHLPPNSEFRVIQGKKSMHQEIETLNNEVWLKFFDAVVKNKILTRAIFTEEAIIEAKQNFSQEELKSIRTRKWLVSVLKEENLPFDELIYMYGNKVVFVFPESSTVVFIKHRRIFQAVKAIFDALHFFAKSEPHPWD